MIVAFRSAKVALLSRSERRQCTATRLFRRDKALVGRSVDGFRCPCRAHVPIDSLAPRRPLHIERYPQYLISVVGIIGKDADDFSMSARRQPVLDRDAEPSVPGPGFVNLSVLQVDVDIAAGAFDSLNA